MTQSNKDLPSAKHVETQSVENQLTLQTLLQALATSHDTDEAEAVQAQIALLTAQNSSQNQVK